MYTRRIVGTKTDLLFSSTLSCTTVGGFLFCTVWQAKYRCLRVCSVLSVLLLLPSSFPENNHSSRVSHTRRKRQQKRRKKTGTVLLLALASLFVVSCGSRRRGTFVALSVGLFFCHSSGRHAVLPYDCIDGLSLLRGLRKRLCISRSVIRGR